MHSVFQKNRLRRLVLRPLFPYDFLSFFGWGGKVNILYSYTYTIGSGYTNKNKFRIVKETLISFNSTIGILWDLEISS